MLPNGLRIASIDVDLPTPVLQIKPQIYLPALESGAFTEVEALGSMRVLRRARGDAGDPVA